MNTKLIRFRYYTNIKEVYAQPGFLYADVPAGLKSLQELLEFYQKIKHITNWHAYNLNAFFDGIRSVEYYPSSLNKIIHYDLPKLDTDQLTAGYLDILNMTIQELELHRELKNATTPPYAAELTVYFPETSKSDIEKLFDRYRVTDIKSKILNDPELKQGIIHWAERTIKSGEWKRWRREVGLSENPE